MLFCWALGHAPYVSFFFTNYNECRKMQLGWCSKRRDELKPSRCTWLPVKQRIIYKMAVITFKVLCTSTPAYPDCHSTEYRPAAVCGTYGRRTLHCFFSLSPEPTLPNYSAPAIWNSLPKTVLGSPSLTVFKSRLKAHLFNLAHTNV